MERLQTELNNWVNGVALQAGRIDRRHRKRHLSVAEAQAMELDLHFFLVALVRLRRCVAKVGKRVPLLCAPLAIRIQDFDAALPWLQRLRNASEHIDEYNLDEGRDALVKRQQVQTWHITSGADGGLIWSWLGEDVDVNDAVVAAATLFRGFSLDRDAWLAARHKIPPSVRRVAP